MKLVRHGLVFLITIYLLLSFMVGQAHFHKIIFVNEACIKPYMGYDYRTCQRMRVLIDGNKFNIPRDFKTDLASIPRIIWPIFSPQYSGFIAPSILHDYLYRCSVNTNRKYADEVFYSALISQGVSLNTAYKFFVSVRLFGLFNYRANRGEC